MNIREYYPYKFMKYASKLAGSQLRCERLRRRLLLRIVMRKYVKLVLLISLFSSISLAGEIFDTFPINVDSNEKYVCIV